MRRPNRPETDRGPRPIPLADRILYVSGADIEAAVGGWKGCCACGEDRAAAMTAVGICYACDMLRRGLEPYEEHHLFGRSSGITFRLPANDHRVLDALRLARPAPLRKMGGGTLQAVAVVLVTVTDVLAVFVGEPRGLIEILIAAARSAALALIDAGNGVAVDPSTGSGEVLPWRP